MFLSLVVAGGRGCGGHPFLGCECNPRLVSNLSNTTLAASVSHLPPAPGQPAILSLLPSPALPLPPPLPAVLIYGDVAASAIGSEPDPISDQTSQSSWRGLVRTSAADEALAKKLD